MILQKYKCHKIVEAAEIIGISVNGELSFGPGNYILCSRYWLDKFKPEVGGYFIKYEDGYTSYSPKEAFEKGYSIFPPKDGIK